VLTRAVSIVHLTTAGRSRATSASHLCPTRAAAWMRSAFISRPKPARKDDLIHSHGSGSLPALAAGVGRVVPRALGTLAGRTRADRPLWGMARKLLIALWRYAETG